MRKVTYNGDIKIIKQIVELLNRKVPTPLDSDGNAKWGTNGQMLVTDGTGSTNWVTPPAEQVQSDWNEADNTKADFIKNKPSDATQSASGLMSAADKTKLDGIAAGAEVNVQADWNEADSTSDAYIANKPSIPAAQIQSDWSQSDNTQADYIKNKPTIPTVNDGTLTIQQNGTTLGTFTANQSGNTTVNLTGGGGSGGHTIENTSGTDLPQEDNLQFVGVYTEDDSANDRTKVNIVRHMTKAAMEALSSAEKEGFIDTTDEDDDYIPISAEDVKYGNTDVESKLDALTTDVNAKTPYVNLGGQSGIESAWDALAIYDQPVVGRFTKSGYWWFIGLKYTGGQYGMMIAQPYYSTTIYSLSVSGGVKTVRTIGAKTVTTLVNESVNLAQSGSKTYATLTTTYLSQFDEVTFLCNWGSPVGALVMTKAMISKTATVYGSSGAVGISSGSHYGSFTFGSSGMVVRNGSSSTMVSLLIEGITY